MSDNPFAETVNPTIATAPAESRAEDKPQPVAPPDPHIWGIYIALVFISILELYSASSREVSIHGLGIFSPLLRHIATLALGLGIMLVLQRTHYRKFIRWIPVLALGSALLMVYVMFFGEEVNGARRNINIGLSIQPSELIKLAAPLIIALILSRTQYKNKKGVTPLGLGLTSTIVLIFGALLLPQGLTNTILLMTISIAMMLIGGIPFKKLIVIILIYAAGAGVFVGGKMAVAYYSASQQPTKELHDKVLKEKLGRISTWMARLDRHSGSGDAESEEKKPLYEQKITPENRQEIYGYMAQANGGVFGVFPGNSRETSRLPLAFSDYIFSIIVEDLGLMGAIGLLVLYLWLLARASAIASRCSRALPALMVVGMAVMVVMQALCHMCIVTGVMPVSGQPLPLISKGGCAVLVISAAFGVMLSVSRFAVRGDDKRSVIEQEKAALPEEVRADNPSLLK